jgi:hypothetical protein
VPTVSLAEAGRSRFVSTTSTPRYPLNPQIRDLLTSLRAALADQGRMILDPGSSSYSGGLHAEIAMFEAFLSLPNPDERQALREDLIRAVTNVRAMTGGTDVNRPLTEIVDEVVARAERQINKPKDWGPSSEEVLRQFDDVFDLPPERDTSPENR